MRRELKQFSGAVWQVLRIFLFGAACVIVALVVIGEFIDEETPVTIQTSPLSPERVKILADGLRQGFASGPSFNFPEYCLNETSSNREYADCIGLAQTAAAQARMSAIGR